MPTDLTARSHTPGLDALAAASARVVRAITTADVAAAFDIPAEALGFAVDGHPRCAGCGADWSDDTRGWTGLRSHLENYECTTGFPEYRVQPAPPTAAPTGSEIFTCTEPNCQAPECVAERGSNPDRQRRADAADALLPSLPARPGRWTCPARPHPCAAYHSTRPGMIMHLLARHAEFLDGVPEWGTGRPNSDNCPDPLDLIDSLDRPRRPRYGVPMRNTRTSGYTTERRCTTCRTWLPETPEFYGYNRRVDRWITKCKPCTSEYNRSRANRTGPSGQTTLGRFGIEIEFHGDRTAAASALRAAGLDCEVEDYGHAVRRHWKIITDATVRNGGELVSPVLNGEAGMAEARAAVAALRSAGCTVSVQTGLHVHHDAQALNQLSFMRAATNWQASQRAIDALVSPSRRGTATGRGSDYTADLTTYDLDSIRSCLPATGRLTKRTGNRLRRINRYKSWNVAAYAKYGTIEVRQHQGTLNGTKITAWINFGQAMLKAAIAGATLATDDPAELLRQLNDGGHLDNDSAHYLAHRSEKLAAQRTAA